MPGAVKALGQALARRFEVAKSALIASAPVRRKYLVAVSGGCDSVVLLDWLRRSGYQNLVVCHVNHHLREAASEADEQFVRDLAAEHRAPCWVADAPLAGEGSVETEARVLRYEALAKIAIEEKCARIFLAHHADDQAETVLWNLLRGCGMDGLGGMEPMSEREVDGRLLTLWRPFLDLDRRELRAYAKAHRLEWREDASNADEAYMRNRLRHTLIPGLEEATGRPIRRALVQMADVAREENRVLEALVLPTEPVPSVAEMRIWPVAIQRRWLLRWLEAEAVPDRGYALVESVREMLRPGGAAKVNLPGGRHVRRTAGRLYLETEG